MVGVSRQGVPEVDPDYLGLFRCRLFQGHSMVCRVLGAEDHDFFLRILDRGWSARRVAEPLLEYRQHSREQTNVQLESARSP
jgi:hypothetical protein